MSIGAPPARLVLAKSAVMDDWPSEQIIWRAHPHDFGSAQFDNRQDQNARFSTIRFRGQVLPVLYGGENDLAVASETIFHTIDAAGSAVRPRRVFLDQYLTWQWSMVRTVRPLQLIRLDGQGLASIGTNRQDLIEGSRLTYATTRSWAEALALARPDADGMWWQSRQEPARWAVVLFLAITGRAGGLSLGDIQGFQPAVPFASPAGSERLDQLGVDLGITIVRP
jgi:hypothetical protein